MRIDTQRHGVKVIANGDIFHFSNVQTAADTALEIMKAKGSKDGITVVTPEGARYSEFWELSQLLYGGAN